MDLLGAMRTEPGGDLHVLDGFGAGWDAWKGITRGWTSLKQLKSHLLLTCDYIK